VDHDGILWIGTTHGLIRHSDDGQSLYTTANGLKNDYILAVRTDRRGRLWLGTPIGPAHLTGGVVSWTRADGLPDEFVNLVVEGSDGRLYAGTHRGGFAEIVGGRAVPMPGSADPPFNSIVDTRATEALQDPSGDWWLVTSTSLHLLKGPLLQFGEGRRLGAAYGILHGTRFGGWTPNIHRDSAGRLWIGSSRPDGERGGIYVYDSSKHESPRFEFLPFRGFDATDEVNALVTDRAGVLWLVTHIGVGRAVDGRVERVDPIPGLASLRTQIVFRDRKGRIWVGLHHQGAIVTAEPEARQPAWRQYSTADGLASDNVRAFAEDESGHIWLGTTRGVARLDPDTGRIRTFDSRNGLAGDDVNHLHIDRRGFLWVSTRTGLTRLDTGSDAWTGRLLPSTTPASRSPGRTCGCRNAGGVRSRR
jgi:ligand-binding sensor domain-containing protein